MFDAVDITHENRPFTLVSRIDASLGNNFPSQTMPIRIRFARRAAVNSRLTEITLDSTRKDESESNVGVFDSEGLVE